MARDWRFSFLLSLLAAFARGNVSSCGKPKHIHLAVGLDSSSSMTVTFASPPCQNDHTEPTGAVMIGTRQDRLDRTVMSILKPFRDNFLQFPHHNGKPKGNYTSDYYHHVQIEGLEPNQKYYYRCLVLPGDLEEVSSAHDRPTITNGRVGHEDEGRRALRVERHLTVSEPEPRYFWTAPPPGQGIGQPKAIEGILKLAILGDLGFQQRGKDTMATLSSQRDEISAVILAGDIAYPRSRPEGWDDWFDVMDSFPAFSELPIQIAAGNHDVEARRNGDVFMEYENRFFMPKIKAPEMRPYPLKDKAKFPPLDLNAMPYPLDYDYGNSFYSFVYGITHTVIINSYANFDPGSNQYRWIVSELESVDRNLTPWLFVTMHVPMYNTFHVHDADVQLIKAKEHLESLFIKYKVNVVFSGHIHAYLRTHPVVNDKVDPSGPVHIVVGDGGREVDAPFKCEEGEEWVAARDATYFGYGTIELFNHTHARWEWVHSARTSTTNYVWHPGPRQNTTDLITLPSVEHDGTYILNQQYL